MSDITTVVGPSKATMEKPMAALRFVLRDGKRLLQQGWAVTVYSDGVPTEQNIEWRDVPLAEEE